MISEAESVNFIIKASQENSEDFIMKADQAVP